MNVATSVAVLRVEFGEGDSVSYTLSVHGEGDAKELRGQAPALLAYLGETAARGRGPEGGDEGGAGETRGVLIEVPPIPGALGRRLRQWAMSGDRGQTLCISCGDDALWALPWEALPTSLGIERVAVARLAGAGVLRSPLRGDRRAVLIAGWPRHGERVLPGIARELQSLTVRLRDAYLPVTALPEPSIEQLREACRGQAPAVIHLAHPGAERSGQGEELRLQVPDEEGGVRWIGADDLAGLLSAQDLSLVVLSTCAGGISMARILAERLGAIVVGWPGQVGDAAAADFSLFFHERLLEGSTPVAAVDAFRRGAMPTPTAGPAELPVVWVPTSEAIAWSPLVPAGSTEAVFRGGIEVGGVRGGEVYRSGGGVDLRGGAGARGEARVSLTFEPLAAVNPALLLNGRPAIERLSVESSDPIEGVQLRIECDAGAGASVYRRTVDLVKGTQPLELNDARFPVLYDLIRQRAERRYINFIVRLTAKGVRLAETTRSVLWMGPNEWMDAQETWPFIPAFVQPNSKGVLEVLGRAIEVLRHTGDPKNAFWGYQGDASDDVRLQMKTFFTTLREPPFTLKYVNPPSGAVYVPGSPSPTGQRVRFADDVVEQKRGTCHDLALLFASCAEHVGIHPLVILIRGHTFVGFWTNAADQRQFWAGRARFRGHQFGDKWIMDREQDLSALVTGGAVEVFEATKVTNPQATYEEARAEGERRISEIKKNGLDAAVDVSASRCAVQPM